MSILNTDDVAKREIANARFIILGRSQAVHSDCNLNKPRKGPPHVRPTLFY